jgi:hypothetical protein
MKTTIMTFALALATMPLTFAGGSRLPAASSTAASKPSAPAAANHQEACQRSGQEDREARCQHSRGSGEKQ